MTRVPLLPSTALPPDLAETYETFARNYGPFRNQAAVLAHVPPALDHLVTTCIAKDPDARWQNASDVLLQLQWIAQGGSQAGIVPRLGRGTFARQGDVGHASTLMRGSMTP